MVHNELVTPKIMEKLYRNYIIIDFKDRKIVTLSFFKIRVFILLQELNLNVTIIYISSSQTVVRRRLHEGTRRLHGDRTEN